MLHKTKLPEMVPLPPGSFLMGSDQTPWEQPPHVVHIKYEFSMGKYLVTFEEYDAFCSATGHKKPHDEGWGRGNRPVINVSWRDAVAYCEWLSEQTGKTYRLPSEAEWEYACRAGSESDYYFDRPKDSLLGEYVWYSGNSMEKTHPVGEKQPNSWGLYDMYGNVWEWCQDRWHGNYQNAPADGTAWTDGRNNTRIFNTRIFRGGSWNDGLDRCRSAFRAFYTASQGSSDAGFRVVCIAHNDSDVAKKPQDLTCAGLVYRAEVYHGEDTRGVTYSARLRKLKTKSCKGCSQCQPIEEALADIGRDTPLKGIKEIKHGEFYEIKMVNISTDPETGYSDFDLKVVPRIE